MPEVIRIADQHELVPTAQYPHAKWGFSHFNPVQSRLVEVFNSDANIAVAAATSAGKTVCSEIYLAHEIHKRKKNGVGVYVGPLKALAREKQRDWSKPSHHFSGLKTSIVSGDFRLTANRLNEVDEADLIVMTPEMLASRCRNHRSDKSSFLKNVGTIAFDESHLLTVPGRGDHIEVALMKLTEINPDARVVLLSATMPNVDEICGWLSKITGRDTYFLESEYRPCPLNVHYETYYDGDGYYDDRENEKVRSAAAIVEHYSDDKFLIFVHTKNTGRKMVEHLREYGVQAEFHNADAGLEDREKFEDRFMTDKNFRVLVSTSTLAWGMNLPARRVIIVGVHRGTQVVENYDIWQMVGRAGRLGLDPAGDAYVLVPESEEKGWVKKIKMRLPIKSQLLASAGPKDNPIYKTLAFHLVAEINRGTVKTKAGFHDWFHRSLAFHQNPDFDETVIDKTIGMLEFCRAIVIDNGEYKCTSIGKIASMFYYSPFDVSDLRRNFKFLFDKKEQGDDLIVSLALANIDSHRWGIANKSEKEAMAFFRKKVVQKYGEARFSDSVLKVACCYHNMLKGIKRESALSTQQNVLFADMERMMQVVRSIETMSGKWGQEQFMDTLKLRLRYGVPAELAHICQIPNVGGVRAKRLTDHKIKTPDDFLKHDAKTLAKIMQCSPKLAEKAIVGAKEIVFKEAL